MGCFGSAEVVPLDDAPVEEEDPMVKLLAEVERLRAELRGEVPKLQNSSQKWRYMATTLDKLRHLNNHLGSDLANAADMHTCLTYHIAEQDAMDIHEASAGVGTDEEKMGRVVLGRLRENVMLTDQIYQKRYGRTLEDQVRGENKTLAGLLGADSLSHFGRFLTYRTMTQPKRDALLFRRCVSGWGCADFILIELLSTRTNTELKAAAEFYAQEFEGEDMVERVKTETGGFGKKWYGKWIDVLVEFDRDESGQVADGVEGLAQQLYKAGAGKWTGTDEQVFIDILAKANEETVVAIAAAYDALEDSKRTLVEDVEKEMGGDLEFAVLARVRPRMDFFAYRLFKACKGWGTDEECICRVLGCLENGEVIRLAARYNELYGEEDAPLNDFSTMMESELSGSLLDGIKHLLESLPPKSHWDLKDTYEPKAGMGAEEFRAHLEGNFDDEKAELLGGTELHGPLHLLNVEEHFVTPGYDYHLECSRPTPEPFDTSYLLDSPPPDCVEKANALIGALQGAITTVQQDTEKNVAACEGSKAMYYDNARDMRFKDHLLSQHIADNNGMLEFCAQRDAEAVHEAVEGWGTDEDKLIRILCSLTKAQLRRVDEIYAESYGQSLREVTDGELGGFFEGSFKYFMKCAMTPSAELDAELLVDSMKGLGTDDALLCELCCTRTNRELEEAKAIFAEKEGKSVEEWVEGDTSGFYTTFLLRCLQAKRQEGLVDERLAGIQADKLKEAGFGGDGEVDEATILKIMVPASEEQMRLISQAYQAKHGKTLVEAIEDMGGEMKRALIARVHDRLTFYATVLHNAFSGLGTDEKATARVLGRNSKADVKRIGERYEELFGGSLRQAINGETSGNFKKAMLTYIYAEAPGVPDEAVLDGPPEDPDLAVAEEAAPPEEEPPAEEEPSAEEEPPAEEEPADPEEVDAAMCADGAVANGTRVKTLYTEAEGGDGEWYSGVITKLLSNGTCSILYDDGDTWTGSLGSVHLAD